LVIVIAFIATCETVLFFARRNPQFIAKLYLLDDVLRFDEATNSPEAVSELPKPGDENEQL
jgi:hypothetical protein